MKGECGFCGYEGKVTKCKGGIPERKVNLCDLCYNTVASNAEFYPKQYDGETIKAIMQVGNIILDKLKESQK